MSEQPREMEGGLALVCARDGRVERVLRDDFGLMGTVEPGSEWSTRLHASSIQKSQLFLAEVIVSGSAIDWELGVALRGAVSVMHFAGAVTDDAHVLIVGGSSRSLLLQYYEELMRINNEQANALRAALKNRALASDDGGTETYDRMMQLNNELTSLQRELTRRNMELERVNRLKNQFVGMAAHDLRNPLGAIRSFSTMLLDPDMSIPPEKAREFIGRIRSSSEFMLRLIDDLLDIAAIEAGQLRLDLRLWDMAELLRRNLVLMRVLSEEKGIVMEVVIDDDVPSVMVDAEKVEQIVSNIISNAIKFSNPGTQVRIDLTRDGDAALLSVTDQGPGIPDGDLAQLFKPFGRGSTRPTSGEHSTGLGLAITQRIVQGHGGTLWCESIVGQGTTFHVRLPASPSL